MKIHSFLTVNAGMCIEYLNLKALEEKLRKRVVEVEGGELAQAWERATIASWRQLQSPSPTVQRLDPASAALSSSAEPPATYRAWAAVEKQSGSSVERPNMLEPSVQKLVPHLHSPVPEHERVVAALSAPVFAKGSASHETPNEFEWNDPHPFAWHPNPQIRDVAAQISLVRDKLYAVPQKGMDRGPMWPHNVTYANFWDFQLVPTLVYKLRYPRTNQIRLWYILERSLAFFGVFFVSYVIVVTWVIPVVEDSHGDVLSKILRLTAPMTLCVRSRGASLTQYLLIFYAMFECICTTFAEITRCVLGHRMLIQLRRPRILPGLVECPLDGRVCAKVEPPRAPLLAAARLRETDHGRRFDSRHGVRLHLRAVQFVP